MGEHAAVYGRPALIAAVDLWMRVTITGRTSGSGIAIDLQNLGHEEETTWPAVEDYADRVRRRWHQYVDNPTAQAFARMRGNDPAHLVKVALGEARRQSECIEQRALRLNITSEQPIGSGFGSSAAVAVGVLRALYAFQEVPIDDDVLYRQALEVERRQHGTPSGIDPATVVRGGIVWAEPREEGAFAFQPVACRSPELSKVDVYHSGDPKESTGTVVDAVRERRAQHPEAIEAVLDRMEAATHQFYRVLTHSEERTDDLMQSIRNYEAGLEELGVVPEAVQERVRAIEQRGGAAKISGAGALSGTGAGSLLVYHPDPASAELDPVLESLPQYAIELGVKGNRREVAA